MQTKFRIVIGSDHGGFELKKGLIAYLRGQGHEVKDVGCYSTESYDFPVSATDVARAIAAKTADRGIVIDGAGSPSAMVANKTVGVRASVVWNEFTAKISREHSDANVLAFGAKVVELDQAKVLAELWLRTDFLGGKYQKRIDMITEIEKKRAGALPRKRTITAADIEAGMSVEPGPDVTLTPLAREMLQRKG